MRRADGRFQAGIDITEREQFAALLQQSEERRKATIEATTRRSPVGLEPGNR